MHKTRPRSHGSQQAKVLENKSNTKHARTHTKIRLTDDGLDSHAVSGVGRGDSRRHAGRWYDRPPRHPLHLMSLRSQSTSDAERGSNHDVMGRRAANAHHAIADSWDDDELPPEQPWHRIAQGDDDNFYDIDDGGDESDRHYSSQGDNDDDDSQSTTAGDAPTVAASRQSRSHPPATSVGDICTTPEQREAAASLSVEDAGHPPIISADDGHTSYLDRPSDVLMDVGHSSRLGCPSDVMTADSHAGCEPLEHRGTTTSYYVDEDLGRPSVILMDDGHARRYSMEQQGRATTTDDWSTTRNNGRRRSSTPKVNGHGQWYKSARRPQSTSTLVDVTWLDAHSASRTPRVTQVQHDDVMVNGDGQWCEMEHPVNRCGEVETTWSSTRPRSAPSTVTGMAGSSTGFTAYRSSNGMNVGKTPHVSPMTAYQVDHPGPQDHRTDQRDSLSYFPHLTPVCGAEMDLTGNPEHARTVFLQVAPQDVGQSALSSQ